MFSGGDFHEVARWLLNFLNSHAKRESPRVEALVEADDDRPTVYGVRLRLGERLSPRVELDFQTVADNRGSLAWCSDLAAQVRGWARDLLVATPPSPTRSTYPAASRSGPGRP
jgi:hypothetical protein